MSEAPEMKLRTAFTASLMKKVGDPGDGTGAPMADRMPNMAPSLFVLPTLLHIGIGKAGCPQGSICPERTQCSRDRNAPLLATMLHSCDAHATQHKHHSPVTVGGTSKARE